MPASSISEGATDASTVKEGNVKIASGFLLVGDTSTRVESIKAVATRVTIPCGVFTTVMLGFAAHYIFNETDINSDELSSVLLYVLFWLAAAYFAGRGVFVYVDGKKWPIMVCSGLSFKVNRVAAAINRLLGKLGN
jgi:hypothetical protein